MNFSLSEKSFSLGKFIPAPHVHFFLPLNKVPHSRRKREKLSLQHPARMYNEKYNEKCKKKHRVCLSVDYELIQYGKVNELIYFILFLLLDNTNTDCLL